MGEVIETMVARGAEPRTPAFSVCGYPAPSPTCRLRDGCASPSKYVKVRSIVGRTVVADQNLRRKPNECNHDVSGGLVALGPSVKLLRQEPRVLKLKSPV